jgi:hypothetical protein
MFGREAATLHFFIGYHQNHLTASFNLNQLELFTKKKLTLFLLHRRMFPSGKHSKGAGIASDRMNVICREFQMLFDSYT